MGKLYHSAVARQTHTNKLARNACVYCFCEAITNTRNENGSGSNSYAVMPRSAAEMFDVGHPVVCVRLSTRRVPTKPNEKGQTLEYVNTWKYADARYLRIDCGRTSDRHWTVLHTRTEGRIYWGSFYPPFILYTVNSFLVYISQFLKRELTISFVVKDPWKIFCVRHFTPITNL